MKKPPRPAPPSGRITTFRAAEAATSAVAQPNTERVSAADAMAIASRVDLLGVIEWRGEGRPRGVPRSTARWLSARLALSQRPLVWAALWNANPDPSARHAMLGEAITWSNDPKATAHIRTPENEAAVRDFLLGCDDETWQCLGASVIHAIGWGCLWDRTPAMATLLWRYLEGLARDADIYGYMPEAYELLEGYFGSAPELLRAEAVIHILQHPHAEMRTWAMTRWVPQLSGVDQGRAAQTATPDGGTATSAETRESLAHRTRSRR